MRGLSVLLGLLALFLSPMIGVEPSGADEPAPPPRVLPPAGKPLPDDEARRLEDSLALLDARLALLRDHRLRADVEIYAKAVRYALRHGEFYGDKDLAKAQAALQQGNERIAALAAGQSPWTTARGTVVRGYLSSVDGSAQPYGLVVPKELDLSHPVPLYVWLHGRGDKQTDLHFIHERQTSVGQIAPTDAIVLHPFGRQCLGFKSAGEIDVLEAVDRVRAEYPIDADRIVLIGFSMGGAGAWHLGAHYPDRWCAVSPGAGFAETARYVKLAPEQFPPVYEQRLWGCYDAPAYVRNLFNLPVIAYSGELDKQIQAARVMEAAFEAEGRRLDHRIGPGVEHRYEAETLKKLMSDLGSIVKQGRDRRPKTVSLQTQTLRYGRSSWVEARGLVEHWRDSRIDATYADERRIDVTTRNVTAMRLAPPFPADELRIDGAALALPAGWTAGLAFEALRTADGWTVRGIVEPDGRQEPSLGADQTLGAARPGKSPGLQGPIDDAFLEPFVVVTPTGRAKSRDVERWTAAELAHWDDRWRSVFRGELPRKRDDEVTDADVAEKHLVLFGDAESNAVIKRINGRLPIHWPNGQVQAGDRRFPADRHLPVLICPNPLNPRKYVVLNSGPTFRAVHDRTNSQQNPKLPDWAVLEISQPPDGERAGRVIAADFFDERWELRREAP